MHVSGSNNLEVKRFIDNLKNLGFDESFLNDYLLIGMFFNVPLEILGDFLRGKGLSSQGDAKEKAMLTNTAKLMQVNLTKGMENVQKYKAQINKSENFDITKD